MTSRRKATILVLTAAFVAGVLFCDQAIARAQAQGPLTYPEIITALQTKLPNQAFKNKTQLLTFVVTQIKRRKVDKPLTKDREDDLRQAGATDELVSVIRTNSPTIKVEPVEPVDLGDLIGQAVDLVRPEYTPEARQAKTTGEVKLALELDETGRVTKVTRLTVLPNGLTESAIEAARKSRFRPAMRDGKPARATGVIKYNFKLNLLDVAATLASANAFRDKSDCDKAIAEYGRVIDVQPKHAKALLGRGTCHLIEANYSLAATDLSNAAASDPRDSDAVFFLALALDFKGDPTAAAENYAKALRLRPELDSQPTFQCLYIDRRQMTPEQARAAANGIINACERSIRGAAPEISAMLYYKRGIAYRMKGDYDKAIEEFESLRRSNQQFTAINTQLQIAYNSRGLEAFNKKNFREAFDDVSLAIHADPQSPTPYVNRCAIYLYARKQYREAIEDCTAAIRLGTRSSMAYNHRGKAYELINSLAEAISDYKKALDLDPRNETARTSLNRLQSERPSMKY
jgi:TonB family protein